MSLEQIQKLIDIALKIGEYECACPEDEDEVIALEDHQCLNCAIKEILQR